MHENRGDKGLEAHVFVCEATDLISGITWSSLPLDVNLLDPKHHYSALKAPITAGASDHCTSSLAPSIKPGLYCQVWNIVEMCPLGSSTAGKYLHPSPTDIWRAGEMAKRGGGCALQTIVQSTAQQGTWIIKVVALIAWASALPDQM